MAVDNKSSWRAEAFEEYTERRLAKIAEIESARKKANHFAAIATTREQELADLDKAAKTLGIVVEFEHAPEEAEKKDDGEAGGFKEVAINLLTKAYPNPVRAADLQTEVERITGRKYHPKTAGMTLYRLSQQHIVRRHGRRDWYYVPEDEQQRLIKAAEGFTEVYEIPSEETDMEN